MTTAAPPRSRDELAALGKKKLEEFRRRKLQKAAAQAQDEEVEQDQASGQPAPLVTEERTVHEPTLAGHGEDRHDAPKISPQVDTSVSTAFVPAEVTSNTPVATTLDEQPGEDTVASGFFDSIPDLATSTSTPREIVEKKVSFDARKFMVMAEPESDPVASPSSPMDDSAPPAPLDDGSIRVNVDGRPSQQPRASLERSEPNSAAPETEAEPSAGTMTAGTISDARRGSPTGTNAENRDSTFLPPRQSKQSSKFQELQDHIDSLTTQNLDLSLCLSQQTTMVQRLTEENEGLVQKLNEASQKAEQWQEREKAHDQERDLMGTRWRETEQHMTRMEKENRDLTSKVKILGGELVELEEKLLRERNERLKLLAMPAGANQDASREEVEKISKALFVEREEKMKLQAHLRSLEAMQQSLRQQLAAEQTRADKAESAAKTRSSVYPIPPSATISGEAMEAFAEREANGELPPLDHARLSDEVRALLPINSWIPSMEEEQKLTMQQDIVDAIGRLYERIEELKRDDADETNEKLDRTETGHADAVTEPTRVASPVQYSNPAPL